MSSVLDFAIDMEKDGEEYYRRLAKQTSNSGLKTIFTRMADDEVAHIQLFTSLKEQTDMDIKERSILEVSKNIFTEMKESGSTTVDDAAAQKDAYGIALDMELKSFHFYEAKAEEAASAEEKKLLLAIAREERRHYRVLENIIEFIGRPEEWLEDAEFVHLTEY